MSRVGEKRDCPSCHEFVQVVELIPNEGRGEGWYIQKLSCGHTGNISIMDSLVETVKIEDKVKATKIDHKYGQVYSKKALETLEVFLVRTRTVDTQEHSINSYQAIMRVIIIVTCVNVITIFNDTFVCVKMWRTE